MTLLASPEPSATFIETNAVTIKTPDTSAQPQSPSNARPASPNAIRARATSRYAAAVGSSRLRHDMERSARLEATPRPATATMLNTVGRSQSITEAPHRRGSAEPVRRGRSSGTRTRTQRRLDGSQLSVVSQSRQRPPTVVPPEPYRGTISPWQTGQDT